MSKEGLIETCLELESEINCIHGTNYSLPYLTGVGYVSGLNNVYDYDEDQLKQAIEIGTRMAYNQEEM